MRITSSFLAVFLMALCSTKAHEGLPHVNHHLSAQFLPLQSRGEKVSAVVYYPDDEWFLGSPQWAVNNTGLTRDGIPGKAGADIGMTRVWDLFDGDDSLIIAVLDAGFNFNHPDLQGRWFRNTREINGTAGVDDDHNGVIDDTAGWDFVDNDNSPQDYEGHGTEVSGVIAASFDNGIGISGMIPRVKILPVRVLNTVGQGYTTTIAAGIRYAVKMHANVINYSIGGGSTDTALKNAFQFARDSGVTIVAAAGNDSTNLDTHPAPPSSYGFDNVYMVAAHNHAGNLSPFSNYGATTVPMAAPGQYILSTGIPQLIPSFRDTFDLGTSNWTFAAASDFVLSTTTPLQGTKTLQWSATANTWAATTNNIDLTGQIGSSLWFLINYKPATLLDQLIVEGQIQGTTTWTQFALINGTVPTQWLSFDTHAMDGKLFKLRFRTVTTGVTTGRVFRLDDVRVYHQGTSLAEIGTAYPTVSGTSLSAPYMAGYIGLLKVACKRMGVAFTRSLVLAAATPESGLSGKVSTGGRLDVSKGLNFYLTTLPKLIVSDSTKTSWTVGQQVAYALSVTPTPTAPAYTYSVLPTRASGTSFICNPVSPCGTVQVISSTPGSTLSSAGAFAWNSTGGQVNNYVTRFRADKSPLVLRKMMTFSLKAVLRVAGSHDAHETLLWIGEKAFVLPPSFFQASNHQLRVESVRADGRVQLAFSGNVEMPAAAAPAAGLAYQIPGLSGVDWRVWADGMMLHPVSHK